MSYLSRVDYTGNGATQNFSVPFEFISRTHVVVSINFVAQDLNDDYTWLSDSQIRFVTAPVNAAAISIYRSTPKDEKLVDFTDVAVLTEADLDLNATQQLFLVQEMFDTFVSTFLNADGAAVIIDQILQEVLEQAIVGELGQLLEDVQALKDELDLILASNFTLDFAALPELTDPEVDVDFLAILDVSEDEYCKIKPENLFGAALGDGCWYASVEQALSSGVAATVAFGSANYNGLDLGTFSLVTGKYTMGAAGGRIAVTAQATVKALNAGANLQLWIRVNSTDVCRDRVVNAADSTAQEMVAHVSKNLNLAAGDTVEIRAQSSTAESLDDGVALTNLNIVELG